MEYRKKLREKWGGEKGVRSIEKRRRLPSSIHNATQLKRTMLDARKVKEDNRRRHTKDGDLKPKAERKSELSACGFERRFSESEHLLSTEILVAEQK
jgi:WD repeat and SOF domain-containing protein 1